MDSGQQHSILAMEPVLHERVYCVIVARKSDSIQRHDPMGVSLDRTLRLIDVRQIGPDSERDISARCSACGVVLIARLDNREVQPGGAKKYARKIVRS